MKVLVLFSLSVSLCLAESALDKYWQRYKDNHSKQYDDLQGKYRRIVWEKKVLYINQHNLEADLGLHSYRLGINEYSDQTVEEHNKILNGYRPSNVSKSTGSHFIAPDNVETPEEVDWRSHGYVTGVKNQDSCGSCWAFSATGSLEGQHFKKTGKLVSLSEQNLVDCSKKEGNHGCMGGLMNQAFDYIKENDGIDTETSYPYEGRDDTCRFRRADVGSTDTGYVHIPEGDEEALMKAVATVGPVSVAIDASRPTFHEYRNGVYEDEYCSNKKLDHGVLVVGYGKMDGNKYWLVKNSWGESWGMDGYFMLARDSGNMCGVATQASYPLV